jgi:flagellar protein FliO/FliZ
MLAMIPVALKWVQRRVGAGIAGSAAAARIVSAVGVGPNQRVVTVEVGPESARVWLTLGVTAQSIHCLHTMQVSPVQVADVRSTGDTSSAILTAEQPK